MQGVLIASSQPDVKHSLTAILQEGRTVRHCRTVSECLSLSSVQHFDYIFIDDVFEDGDAHELVRRLSSLGYSLEMVPIMMSDRELYTEQFKQYGVKCCITKPFDVEQVEKIVRDLEELLNLYEIPLPGKTDNGTREGAGRYASSPSPRQNNGAEALEGVDVREVSQRLRRLLSRLSDRQNLVRAFAESLREQFDVDNAVILLPENGKAHFTVQCGDNVPPEIVEQFEIPFDDPLVAELVRLNEPVWVYDRERLGKKNAIAATRYGEMLNVQVLSPILSRGRLLAIVGMSRFHRYENSPDLINLLRLFFTFFAETLDNTEMYEKTDSSSRVYLSIVDAFPAGCVSVNSDGYVNYVNPQASEMLSIPGEEMLWQRVEKINTHVADAARECMARGMAVEGRTRKVRQRELVVSAVPLASDKTTGGALVMLDYPAAVEEIAEQDEGGEEGTDESAGLVSRNGEDVWNAVSGVVAHNFKNALVPVKTCAELLPQRYNSEEFRQSFFSVVQDNVEQIDRWIKQLLEYGQPYDQLQSPVTFRLQDMVKKVLGQINGRNEDSKVRIDEEYAENDVVRTHIDQLEHACNEVIKNALEAIRENPEPSLKIATVCDDSKVKLLVRDNGGGFKEVDCDKARQPCTTTKLNGLGMGLACVDKVMKNENGELKIENVEDGACVTLE
ncbi:MAG: ATP-binding protein, partial [Lentisphaeria bacterium]